jgi:hypothetical protein
MSDEQEPTLEDYVKAFCTEVEAAEWQRDPKSRMGQHCGGYHPFVFLGPPSAWSNLRRWVRDFRTTMGQKSPPDEGP